MTTRRAAKGKSAEFRILRAQTEELRERYPAMKDDALFVLWFLLAYVTESESAAAEAVLGGANDKSVDAIHIDEAAKVAYVIQGKCRQALGAKAEKRADVLTFAQLARTLTEPDPSTFAELLAGADPVVSEKLKLIRQRLLKGTHRLQLYYATLGACSSALVKEAAQTVRVGCRRTAAQIDVFDGTRIMVLLRDYLDGVAPPIPSLDLEMENSPVVDVNGVLQRYDREHRVESWVFPMRGDAVAALYERAGVRLFARNIRGFLGLGKEANRGMVATLRDEPEQFFYYNNGVTIICDRAEKRSSKGRDVLRVDNPQVINGQQTTRVLASVGPVSASKATVIVKVMQVSRSDGAADDFDSLVSRIVAGTNWQSAIRASDLMANDRRQIEIERAFRKLGYLYLRKRQTKGEARRTPGGRNMYTVRVLELAQAVAGCDLDPLVVRSGKEKLFEETLYTSVFPNSDPKFYLPRYWLMRHVSKCTRGRPRRGYAKWMALNFVWSHLAPLVRAKKGADAFRRLCETRADELSVPLERAADRVLEAALQFYRANSGRGEEQIDISQFFKNRRGLHKEFERYWRTAANKQRSSFSKSLTAVAKAIATFES